MPGRKEFRSGNMVDLIFPATCTVLIDYLTHPVGQRNYGTFIPAKQIIQRIRSELVFIFGYYHIIPALTKIIGRCMDCTLQRSYCLIFFIAAAIAPWFILKNKEKTACYCLAGTDLQHEL